MNGGRFTRTAAAASRTRGPAANRRRSAIVLLAGLGAAALLASSLFPPRPRLVWNASASAPIGLYRIRDARHLAAGTMVLARIPERYRRLAAKRHYLPSNVPLLKRIAAAPGNRVCATRATITINGRPAAERAAHDAHGRPMPRWTGCTVLGSGAYVLLMDNAASFDGRYFGPTRRADIIGQAAPVWLR